MRTTAVWAMAAAGVALIACQEGITTVPTLRENTPPTIEELVVGSSEGLEDPRGGVHVFRGGSVPVQLVARDREGGELTARATAATGKISFGAPVVVDSASREGRRVRWTGTYKAAAWCATDAVKVMVGDPESATATETVEVTCLTVEPW